jgi:hypothetical protein
MLNHNQLLIGGLVISNIALLASVKAVVKNLEKQKHDYKKLHNMMEYMVNIIEENEIELSEFDMVALGYLSGDTNAA